ncbi:uncharacterized protein METZ01_LOCUS322415 [marine metagenome]|uniref:Uncharacterized protein n=1 Tax=marine metagenome TaxID=408172 RepID=A0A382PCF9_9ZZZZ
MKKYILLVVSISVISISCKKDLSYGVEAINALPPNAQKTKLKTNEQFISILYANLFQKALGASEMIEIKHCIEAFGDKETIHEVIVSNLMNRPDVIIPSDSLMRADIDGFLNETYERFYVRDITEAEKEYLTRFIETNPIFSAEMLYMAFALSDEYQYY